MKVRYLSKSIYFLNEELFSSTGPTVSFFKWNIIVEEGGTNTSICLEIHGLGHGSLGIPVVAELDFANSEDFSFSATEVTFPNGSLSGSTECVLLYIVDDNILEGDKEIVSLHILSVSPDRVNFVPEDELVITIRDNDAPGQSSLSFLFIK